MTFAAGRYGALCRAYTMRSLHEEGADLHVIATLFGYSEHSVKLMIQWHKAAFRVLPDNDQLCDLPDILDAFRLKKPSSDAL